MAEQRDGVLPQLDVSQVNGCVTLTVNREGFAALKAVINEAEYHVTAGGPSKERRITTPRYVTRSGEFRLELVGTFS